MHYLLKLHNILDHRFSLYPHLTNEETEARISEDGLSYTAITIPNILLA